MTVKIINFSVLSKGNNDIIDVTNKLHDIISKEDALDGLINIAAQSDKVALVVIENDLNIIKDLISTFDLMIKFDINQPIDKLYSNNIIKSTILKNNLTLNFKNKALNIAKNKKIFLIDFDFASANIELSTTIIS